MKNWGLMLVALIGVYSLGFGLSSLSQSEPLLSIQWQWENGRLFERYTNSRTLQFGLRSDGIVVWREVLSTTNSPAENTGIPHRSRARPEIVPPPPPTNQPGPGPLPR